MKKYVLTEETKRIYGSTLYRVKALKDFGNVKAGDLGGFVEGYENLSQIDLSWVANEACVYGNAEVYDNAKVYDNAEVFGNAKVYNNAEVYGNVEVFGNVEVRGNAEVFGNAKLCSTVEVCGNAKVFGNAMVCSYAKVYNYAMVYGYAKIYGYAEVCGNAMVGDNAKVCSTADYIVFKNWWSSGRHFTWTRSNNMWRVGCFCGTGAELIAKAYKDSETSGREYERVVKYVEGILTESKEQ